MVATLEQLKYCHSEYINDSSYWKLLQAMSEGGRSVNKSIKKQLLPNVDNTNSDRTQHAPYDCLIGSIIVKLVSQLMNTSIVTTGSTDPYWELFAKSCAILPDEDADLAPFKAYLAKAILMGLIQGKAVGQIDTRAFSPSSIGEQQNSGSDQPYIILRDRWDLTDWNSDNNGLIFAKLHSYNEFRTSWNSNLTRQHQYTIYETVGGIVRASSYLVTLKDNTPSNPLESLKEEQVIITIDRDENDRELESVELFHTTAGEYRFPIVTMTFPRQLWLADQLFDLQKSYFNQNAGLEWSLLQTNYAVLKFTGVQNPHTGENPASRQKVGDGRYLECTDGEDIQWLEKEGKGNLITMQYLDTIRQRMLEVVHTIANSIASDYSLRVQSGESKKEDRRTLDILLGWYGDRARKFGEQTLDVCSIVRNENTRWSIDGFCDYNSADLDEAIATYTGLTRDVGINSPTLKKEWLKSIVSKSGQIFDLDAHALARSESELNVEPFNIDDSQRDGLIRLCSAGFLDPRDLLVVLKAAGDLPVDFDIDAAVARINMEEEESEPAADPTNPEPIPVGNPVNPTE